MALANSGNAAINAADLLTELNQITLRIQTIMYNPGQFYEIFGGTVKVDLDKLLTQLQKREEILRKRLNNIPYWVQQDFEGAI